MEWTQSISVMATVIATGYYIHREVQQDIRASTARTDRLYEMFCDLQKQTKDELLAMKKEQYEFMNQKNKSN